LLGCRQLPKGYLVTGGPQGLLRHLWSPRGCWRSLNGCWVTCGRQRVTDGPPDSTRPSRARATPTAHSRSLGCNPSPQIVDNRLSALCIPRSSTPRDRRTLRHAAGPTPRDAAVTGRPQTPSRRAKRRPTPPPSRCPARPAPVHLSAIPVRKSRITGYPHCILRSAHTSRPHTRPRELEKRDGGHAVWAPGRAAVSAARCRPLAPPGQ
jgi:hypothetical protein